jgi:hypothetical protein
MKAEHTKGPWKVSGAGHDRKDLLQTGEWFCPDIVDRDAKLVAEANGILREVSETEANARLIAAAPDMYEACKRAEQRLCAFGETESCMTLRILRAALAKAKGEQRDANNNQKMR